MPDQAGRFIGISVPADAWERVFGPKPCDLCEGDGQVLVGFGLYSDMRPGIKRCPDCDGTGEA